MCLQKQKNALFIIVVPNFFENAFNIYRSGRAASEPGCELSIYSHTGQSFGAICLSCFNKDKFWRL